MVQIFYHDKVTGNLFLTVWPCKNWLLKLARVNLISKIFIFIESQVILLRFEHKDNKSVINQGVI